MNPPPIGSPAKSEIWLKVCTSCPREPSLQPSAGEHLLARLAGIGQEALGVRPFGVSCLSGCKRPVCVAAGNSNGEVRWSALRADDALAVALAVQDLSRLAVWTDSALEDVGLGPFTRLPLKIGGEL